MELKEFDRNDWRSFAGAESPSETQQPMIAYVDDGGDDLIAVIADKNGLGIIRIHPDVTISQLQIETSFDNAVILGESLSQEAILALKLKRI